MNARKRFSNMVTLLAVLTTLTLTAGLAQAQGPEPPQELGESNGLNQPEALDGPASVEGYAYGFLAIGVPDEDEGATDSGAVNVIYGSSGGLSSTDNQLWHQDSAGILGGAEDNDFLGRALAVGDFDSDGYLDLAIGVPNEDYGATDNGVVHILYGASSGLLSSTGNQLWRESDLFGAGTDGDYDRFGSTLAVGDFDGDGYEDLAVGAKTEKVGDDTNAGAVSIIYGSASGLTASGAQFWHQGTGLWDDPESGDQFGYALAVADFDGDGYDDLAVGVPYEDHNSGAFIENMGGVNIIYGSASGLTSAGTWWLTQNTYGIIDSSDPNDNLGYALAAGDFDGDGYADLAVGVPNEHVSVDQAGAVNVVYGSATGLTAAGNQFYNQQYFGIDSDPEEGDWFGYALTAGDFNGDGCDDLAVGVPYEGITEAPETANAGAVHILFGSTGSGLTNDGSLMFHQGSTGILGVAEANDHFGKTLAVGDFNGDRYADLAIGVPDEDISFFMSTYVDAGAVNVIYGSPTGPTAVGSQFWHQNSADIVDSSATSENFGYALAAYYRVKTYRVYLPLVLKG